MKKYLLAYFSVLGIVFFTFTCLFSCVVVVSSSTSPTSTPNSNEIIETIVSIAKTRVVETQLAVPTSTNIPSTITNTPTSSFIYITSEPTITPTEALVPTFVVPVVPEHPPGTSGKCRDGTYTESDNRRGACSHHGGIEDWWGK